MEDTKQKFVMQRVELYAWAQCRTCQGTGVYVTSISTFPSVSRRLCPCVESRAASTGEEPAP